jgi:hypothetical protein
LCRGARVSYSGDGMKPRPLPLALALASLARAAAAQPTAAEEIARGELVAAAEAARAAGDHARALDLALRAGRVRMTPSLRQLIAYEHEAVGATLDALGAATACAREAEVDPTLRNRAQLLAACTTLRDRLRGRVGRLRVRVTGETAGVVLRVGGVAVDAALWDVGFPALPGELQVEAVRGDARTEERLTLRAGEGAPRDAPGPAATVDAATTVDAAATAATAAAATTATTATPPPSLVGPAVTLAAGGAALVVAGVFAALRADALTARDGACDATGCDPVARDHHDAYRGWTVATNVAWIAGAVTVAAGGAWLGASLVRRRAVALATVAPGYAGLTWSVRW